MENPDLLLPDNEFERLLNLSQYNVDYSEIDGKLDDLARLASHVAGTSIARINIMDANTVWTISNYGLDSKQTQRKQSICQYSILADEAVEVKNLAEDERFKDKKYVTGGPKLRYYFGLPLRTKEGYKIGTLCVMDTKENEISPEKKEFLKIISAEVITRIEYENRLKLMKSNMDELQEIQRKVSHDIRGPIGGIIGIAEILKDQAEESKLDEFMQLLDLINKGGRSVLELADEILTNYKDQTDESRIPKSQTTLTLLKQKLTDLYQPQALNKSISYKVEIENENEKFPFPKHKLLQILGNLISNAIKFTPKNGQVNISLQIEKPGLQLISTIEDNGVGMSEEQVQAMLADEGTSTEGTASERGFGFGFRLAKHLIDSMKGSVKIESKKDIGTKITVHIPL